MSNGSAVTPSGPPAAPPRMTRSRRRTASEFALPADASEVRARVEDIARTLPRFSLARTGPSGATLSRRANLFTWGQTVTISWSPNGQGVEMSVVAEINFPTALGDYGQGRRDIGVLFDALTRTGTPASG